MDSNCLHMWTIYDSPRDYPGHFVVRRFAIGPVQGEPLPDKEPWAVVNSLDAARLTLPDGLYNIHRYVEDEPQIVETWV